MSDQNYQNSNGGWNEVPSQAPIPPQQPIPPAQPVPPQPYASNFGEPAPVAPEPYAPVQDNVNSYSVPQTPPTPPSPPTPPAYTTVPVYDPVKEERDPYTTVNPTAPAYTAAPSYTTPAPSYAPPAAAYQPPAEKKKSGWTIALIIILVLCLCVIVVIGVIWALVASGKYEIQWSYQLLDALRLFV